MKKKYLLIIFFSITILAQKKEGKLLIDSLLIELPKKNEDTIKVAILNQLSYLYRNVDAENGLKLGNQSLLLSKKLNQKNGISLAYYSIGANYSAKSQYDNAIKYFRKALEISSDKIVVCKIYRGIGIAYMYQNNYTKALDYNFKSLKIYESNGDKEGIAAVLSNIGIVYFDLNKNSESIKYYEKSLAINKKLKNNVNMAANFGNLGHVYIELKLYNKAIEYYKKAVEIYVAVGSKYSVALFVGAIANTYFKKKDYNKAILYSNKSMALSEALGDQQIIAFNASLSGDIYLQVAKTKNNDINLLNKALNNFWTAIEIHTKMKSPRELSFDYGFVSEVEELIGNDKKALNFYLYIVLFTTSY